MENIYVPKTDKKRIVIIGGGFAGLELTKKLINKPFQVVLIDINNFHQFQPLFYQVATSGLEPDSISFSFRRMVRKANNIIFRMGALESIDPEKKEIYCDIGKMSYDILVLANGATNNYYGLKDVEENAHGFKTIQEALDIRSSVLQNLEKASNTDVFLEKEKLTNIVVCGGGPAGVEMAGAFAEFKQFVFGGDYKDMDPSLFKVYLIEAGERLLATMSPKSSNDAQKVLENLEVNIRLNNAVKSYDGDCVVLSDGEKIRSSNVVWTAGIQANFPNGLPDEIKGRGNRIKVDQYLTVEGYEDIYAIGDVALMTAEENWPNGHPQVAPTAIQQGELLAKNLQKPKSEWKAFEYKDKGSLATIGKKNAVLETGKTHIHGFLGWWIWATVHLFSISGFNNRVRVGINWISNYLSYDKRNRLIIRKYKK